MHIHLCIFIKLSLQIRHTVFISRYTFNFADTAFVKDCGRSPELRLKQRKSSNFWIPHLYRYPKIWLFDFYQKICFGHCLQHHRRNNRLRKRRRLLLRLKLKSARTYTCMLQLNMQSICCLFIYVCGIPLFDSMRKHLISNFLYK